MKLGLIADDNTGATDAAGMLTERGLRTLLVLDADAALSPAELAGFDALVVGTQNRSIAPEAAAEAHAAPSHGCGPGESTGFRSSTAPRSTRREKGTSVRRSTRRSTPWLRRPRSFALRCRSTAHRLSRAFVRRVAVALRIAAAQPSAQPDDRRQLGPLARAIRPRGKSAWSTCRSSAAESRPRGDAWKPAAARAVSTW